jgi:DNA polymerase I-like protein with 3'-5' exonuclease and polymerase domains
MCIRDRTGNPSVDADSLRAMLLRYPLNPDQKAFIREVRRYRRAQKLLGTYIRPLDGRSAVHPSYNRLPATGRYSSSGPNSQNIPYVMRDMFIAPPGCILVGADADQLEYRVIAEEARAKHSLAWINGGLDPHNETMEIVYGKGIWKMPGAPTERSGKGSGKFKNARDVIKNTRYAWQYAAAAKRIHEQITSVEDDQGELIFGDISLEEVRGVVAGLGRADPEIAHWWEEIQERFRVDGFIGDSLWGRRRYFRNEDKINELVNHPIQAGGAHLIHEAMIELFYGPQEWFATEAINPPGEILPMMWLMNHGHDALYLYPPKAEAEHVSQVLEAAMNRKRKVGALLTYTAAADTGERWNEV